MKHYRILFLFVALVGLWACDEEEQGPAPEIIWSSSSRRYTVVEGEEITIVPDVKHAGLWGEFRWYLDGREVSRERHYIFRADKVGDYFLKLTVSNAFGKTSDEVKITVTVPSAPEGLAYLPATDGKFRWHFSQTLHHVSEGRVTCLGPAWVENGQGVDYLWLIDNKPVAGDSTLCVQAIREGKHVYQVQAWMGDSLLAAQDLQVNFCPPQGTYRRPATAQSQAMVNRVLEYRPAPGYMVNGYRLVDEAFPVGCTHADACDSVLAHMQRRWMTSLGAWGGYMVVGFDHSVENSGGDYDLCIKGNPFSYQNEPGIVWVSQDENGDGLANDTWYELSGSLTGTSEHRTGYGITYFRPQIDRVATGWRDVDGHTGEVPYLAYWNASASYWQPWIEGDSLTFCGSRLASHHTYENGASQMPALEWGYADNEGTDTHTTTIGQAQLLRICAARNWEGRPVDLDYIDFVRIQTGQVGSTPNLGEISTEIYFVGDYHLMK